jgi:hypothetical protein
MQCERLRNAGIRTILLAFQDEEPVLATPSEVVEKERTEAPDVTPQEEEHACQLAWAKSRQPGSRDTGSFDVKLSRGKAPQCHYFRHRDEAVRGRKQLCTVAL